MLPVIDMTNDIVCECFGKSAKRKILIGIDTVVKGIENDLRMDGFKTNETKEHTRPWEDLRDEILKVRVCK